MLWLKQVARWRRANNISFVVAAEKKAIITQLQQALEDLRQKQDTRADTASSLRPQVNALQSRR